MIIRSLEELENDLRSHGFRPLYTVLGPEQYQCRLAVKLLKEQALSPDSVAFDYAEFAGAEAAASEIIEAAGTFPMLSKRRLVLVRDADKLRESEQEILMDSLGRLSPRSMLILSAEDLDRRKRFYKTLLDRSCVAEFQRLKDAALERWAASLVAREGYRIGPASLKKVIDLVGSDLQTLATEFEKLFLYAGEQTNIPDSAIDDMVRSSRQHGIFELINSVATHDRAGSLRKLAALLEAGEQAIGVAAMMARHCRQVLIAKECLLNRSSTSEIGSLLQIKPYFLDQFLRQVRAADAVVVRQMLISLAEIDRKLKSSSGQDRALLEKLICALV